MKLSKGFVVAIILLMVMVIVVEIKIPKKFKWEEPTYAHNDPNPFGGKLVDSILEASLKDGYRMKPGYLCVDDDKESKNDSTLLFIDYPLTDYDKEEIDTLLEIMECGKSIIWVNADGLCDTLCNILDVATERSYSFETYSISHYFANADTTTLRWRGDRTFKARDYRFRRFDIDYSVINIFNQNNPKGALSDSTVWTPVMTIGNSMNRVVAATRNVGKGRFVLVTYPQLFTNYNVLERGGAELMMRLISLGGKRGIVRYDYRYVPDADEDYYKSQSPLRVFLKYDSLRWAVYLALLTIVLSLFFTARRRQRVIPVIKEPENPTIAMVRHIGLMHYRHHDNAAMVRDQFKHFSQAMLRKHLVNVDDEVDLRENMALLASVSGLDTTTITESINRLKQLKADDEIKISDNETKQLIDFMNCIVES